MDSCCQEIHSGFLFRILMSVLISVALVQALGIIPYSPLRRPIPFASGNRLSGSQE